MYYFRKIRSFCCPKPVKVAVGKAGHDFFPGYREKYEIKEEFED